MADAETVQLPRGAIGPTGVPIKRFLAMTGEAGLTGSALSLLQIKDAFVNALQIAYGSDPRHPLLQFGAWPSEFHEAVIRLAYAYGGTGGKARGAKAGPLLEQPAEGGLTPLEAEIVEKLPAVCAKLLSNIEDDELYDA